MERINNEIEKIKAKTGELQARLRELEKQKTELENAEIVDVVRGTDISLSDLAAMLKQSRAGNGGAGTSGQLGPKLEPPKNETDKEDNT